MSAALQLSRLSDSAIRDTVEAVFSQRAYARGILRAPEWLRRFFRWLAELFADIRPVGEGSLLLFWGSIAVVVALVALVVARAVLVRRRRVALAPLDGGGRVRGGGLPRDPWLAAQALAARGDFTEAAHALYHALLASLSRRGLVKLHPAKTAGDYVRELRARSAARVPGFRDFARSYETVVYGLGRCDRERWERLRSLAEPMVARDG